MIRMLKSFLAFAILLPSLAGASVVTPGLYIDDFSASQPLTGTSGEQLSGPGILGGTRSFFNFGTGTLAVTSGQATLRDDSAGGSSSLFLSYGQTADLNADFSSYSGLIIDVAAVSGPESELPAMAVYLSTTSEQRSVFDFNRYNVAGTYFLPFSDFIDYDINPVNFSDVDRITVETILGDGQSITFNSFSVGTVAPVPLPASVWFLASGLALMGWFTRHKKTH